MSVEGRRPRHKPDGDSHNGSAADSDSARGSSILSSPTTPQQPSCCGFSLRGVAQLVARLVRDQEAVGSNPVTPIQKHRRFVKIYGAFYFKYTLAYFLRKLCTKSLYTSGRASFSASINSSSTFSAAVVSTFDTACKTLPPPLPPEPTPSPTRRRRLRSCLKR